MKMDEEDFQFKHVCEEEFDKTYKKINRERQKQIDAQNWNNFMESINNTKLIKPYSDQNNTEVQSEQLINKCTKNQTSLHSSINLLSLYDPYDLNHIHGLRSRLFIVFNEFFNILKNELLPPVLKKTRKVQVKIKECYQKANKNYISDLNLLFSEIKKDSKNKNIYQKKNKTNNALRKQFQMKLIQCYKLAIEAITVCSKTLEAGIYHPVQSKMINLIQIISILSLTTGKYIYGQLYKKKLEESFDLVHHCKNLENILDECGYKETENENHSNNHDTNVLYEFSDKALNKSKTKLFSSNSIRLSMYKTAEPKLESKYAQELAKNQSYELIKNKETNVKLPGKEKENINFDNTSKQAISTPSEILETTKLKTVDNIGFYIVKDKRSHCLINDPQTMKEEKSQKNLPLKNVNISLNECRPLNITAEHEELNCLCNSQSEESIRPMYQMDDVSNVTESIKDDLLNGVLSKAIDGVIKELIMMELRESFEDNI